MFTFCTKVKRTQRIRYFNELHYDNVELVKGLIYGLCIILLIGMLRQVMYLLPHLWYFKVFWTLSLNDYLNFSRNVHTIWGVFGRKHRMNELTWKQRERKILWSSQKKSDRGRLRINWELNLKICFNNCVCFKGLEEQQGKLNIRERS